MSAKTIKLLNNKKIGRCKFFAYMLISRRIFDIFGNATYGTVWSLIFFLIYAALELYLVRARVRDFCGNVKGWTQFYGMGLAIGAFMVLIPIIPAFSAIAPKDHLNIVDVFFNLLMLYPNIYLCIPKRPSDGDIVRQFDFSAGIQSEPIPVLSGENIKRKTLGK